MTARSVALPALIGALLLVAVTFIYTPRLATAPIYLMHDEVNYALQARAIAHSGRDTNGRLMPVYFSEAGFEAGRDPVPIYAMAGALLVLPLSEGAVRLPIALIGVVNVLLMWALARRVFASEGVGVLAALLLALTPSHFVNSRLALAILCPLPFVMVWLMCAERFIRRPSQGTSIGAGLALGVGVYSYLAALLMMPAYLVISLATAWRDWQRPPARLLVSAFLVALLPLVAWHWLHPERLSELFTAYRPMGEASVLSSSAAIEVVRGRLSIAWSFFDPDLWFISGPSRGTNSTRMAGLFPLAFMVLLPIGLHEAWRGRLGQLGPIIVAGCAITPLATVIAGTLDVNRVLFVVPYGVLIATAGAVFLWRADGVKRWLCIGLIASVGVQFVSIYVDYMGPYRDRSSAWFGENMRDAVRAAIASKAEHGGAVWLSARTPIERYWRFYVIAAGHDEWELSPIYYDPATFDEAHVTGRATLVCSPGDPVCQKVGALVSWRKVQRILEPNGDESFYVFAQSDP